MGQNASSVSGALTQDLNRKSGVHAVTIPGDLLDATHEWNQSFRKNTHNALRDLRALCSRLGTHKWEGICPALEVVKGLETVNRSLFQTEDSLKHAIQNVNEINNRIGRPVILKEVLQGTTGGPAGLMLILLGSDTVSEIVSEIDTFIPAVHAMHDATFPMMKKVRNAVPGMLANETLSSGWYEFSCSTMKAGTELATHLSKLLNIASTINKVLQKHASPRPINGHPVKNDAWTAVRTARGANSYSVPLRAFPGYTSLKRKTPPGSEPPAKRLVTLAVPQKSTQKSSSERKKVVAVAKDKTFAEISAHLKHEVDAMTADNTKYQAVLSSVQHVTPSPPDDNGDNVWDQFEGAVTAVRDWAINFVVALQNAPIENSTRRETFDVVQNFYTLMQKTSLRLQTYRIFLRQVKYALDSVLDVFVLPEDIKLDLQKMADNDLKLKKIKAYAESNKEGLAFNLKALSAVLNDRSELSDLLNLHTEWVKMNNAVQSVQIDVKNDIEAFKAKMRRIGWISMAITAVVGVALVIGTMGAAAPEVAAAAAEEVAETAAIEAAEVGTEVAVDTMVDGAVDAAVEAGEVEAEAEAAVVKEGGEGATELFSQIGEGFGKISVVASLSTGAKEYVEKLQNQQLSTIKLAVDGLDDLQKNASLIEVMLLYIYKDWVDLDATPIISANDPLKSVYATWGTLNPKPLLKALADAQKTLEDIQQKVHGAEDKIDAEIGSYNKDVYQPMLKMFG